MTSIATLLSLRNACIPLRRCGQLHSKSNGAVSELRPVLEEDGESSAGAPEESDKTASSEASERREFSWEKLRRLLVVCLLVLLILFAAAAYSLVGPILPVEASDKGSSSLSIGIIIGASPLSLVILSPVFGYYLPKLGVRFTIITGICLLGGAFFLLGFLPNMPPGAVFVLFGVAMRVAEGVGWAMGRITALALLPSLYPSHIGLLTGLLLGFEGVGYTFAPPIGSFLVSISDYSVPFWAVGGVILMLVPLAFLVVKPKESLSTKVLPFRTLLKLLSNLNFSMLLLTYMVTYTVWTFIFTTLALYLKNKVGLSQVQRGIMFGAMGGSYILFAFPLGKLSDIFGARIFVICGLFVEGASMAFMGLTPDIPLPQHWTVMCALILLGFAIAIIEIPVYSDLLDQALSFHLVKEEERDALASTVSGLTTFFMSLGEFAGALLGGFLMFLTDFPSAVLMLSEVATANALLVLGVTLIDYFHGKHYKTPKS